MTDLLDERRSAWRGGADVAIVAPFGAPGELAGAEGRTLVLADTDVSAIVLAAALEAGLFIRTTAREDRTRVLVTPPPVGPPLVVTSIDSLHSPVLCRELREALGGVPWLLYDADRVSALTRGSAGRGAWVRSMRDSCGGGGLLERHCDRRLAPEDAPLIPGRPGALRVVEDDGPGPLLLAGRGVACGSEAMLEDFGHRLGEGGLARRSHDPPGLRRGPWREAARAVREDDRGVDAFVETVAAVPGRVVRLMAAAVDGASLCTSRGAVIGVPSRLGGGSDTVDGDAVQQCLGSLTRADDGSWVAGAGGDGGVDPELLADLAAIGAIERLRPAFLAAHTADQRRFRRPLVDREPAYRALHDAYQAAMASWSLAERVELALTDRAPQDLRRLAGHVGHDPAALADLLVTMDDDGVVTASVGPLGGRQDWQAAPGPRWGDAPGELAAAIAELRAARRERASAFESVLGGGSGCRAVRLTVALGVEPVDDCGLCDICDPAGTTWPASLPTRARARSGIEKRRTARKPSIGLDSLFSGLGGSPSSPAPSAPPKPRAATDSGLRLDVVSGDEDRVRAAVEAAGGVEALFARVAFDYSSPGRGRAAAPPELGADLVGFLRAEAAPTPSTDSGRRVRDGLIELRRGTAASSSDFGRRSRLPPGDRARGTSALDGVHRFADRGEAPAILESLAAVDREGGPLAGLVAARRARDAWGSWIGSAEAALEGALDSSPGLPPRLELPKLSATGPAPDEWADALGVLAKVSDGDLEAALDGLPELPGADKVESLLLGALGEWASLWESAEEGFDAGEPPSGVIARLEARALMGAQPPPELSAGIAVAWLKWAERELGADPARADWILSLVRGGRPGTFVALSAVAEPSAVAKAAVSARALPAKLLEVALAVCELDDVLAAVVDAERRAPELWRRVSAGRSAEEIEALATRLETSAPAFARQARAQLEQLGAAQATRQRVLHLAAEGRLAEVVPLIAGLEVGDPELAEVQRQVAQAQRRFTEPLARALVADGAEEAAWAALRQSKDAGWLDAVTVLLRSQTRRHAADGRRAVWLARAFATAGRWAEAERQYSEAATLADGPGDEAEREFEGIELALEAGEHDRVAAWLVRLVRTRKNRSVARTLTLKLWGGKLPVDVTGPLESELQDGRSGLFAGALRAMQQRC